MQYHRRYLQFNDLVIDSYDMIDESVIQTDASTKITQINRSFGHGVYSPNKSHGVFFEPMTVSLTLYLSVSKLPCDYRPFYRRFAISEISKPGKLWAVVNNELIWAYAKLANYSEVKSSRRDTVEINISLFLPEGVWHKADKQKTFLRDYDVCTFMDCYGFKDLDPCEQHKKLDGDCCTDCGMTKDEVVNFTCNCCECDTICKDMALCYCKDLLQEVYDPCSANGFHIVYDCDKAHEFFGDVYAGQKFCEKDVCSGVIAGILYADTDIPTSDFTITLHGHFVNPAITINDNTNVIKGDYEDDRGVLTIKSNGDVYWRKSDCCVDELVDVANWTVPEGNRYRWTLNPGNNRLIIHTNSCCGITCAYVQVDGLTM